MDVLAQHKNARMAPRKLRALREVVVGLPVSEAAAQLKFIPGKGSQIVNAVLKSAVANAVNNMGASADELRVTDLKVNEGIKFRRFQPASRGRAHPIIKRSSHVTVIVSETPKNMDGVDVAEPTGERKTKKTKIETISMQEFSKQAHEHSHETEDLENEVLPSGDAASAGETPKEKASGIKKAQQRGGDKSKQANK